MAFINPLKPSHPSVLHFPSIFFLQDIETPSFILNQVQLEENISVFQDIQENTRTDVYYAAKANHLKYVLDKISKNGLFVDVNSVGELQKATFAGNDPMRISFSGVGKTRSELSFALHAGVRQIKVESIQELQLLAKLVNEQKKNISVSIRMNPSISIETHPYLKTGDLNSKFGIDVPDLQEAFDLILSNQYLNLRGVNAHIGSQIFDLQVYHELLEKLVSTTQLYYPLDDLQEINLGGGFGIRYDGSGLSTLSQLKEIVLTLSEKLPPHIRLAIEPGRSMVGNTMVLLTRVLYTKTINGKNLAIVDASMTENIRPMLYQANHTIIPVFQSEKNILKYDIAGPVCESSDYFAKDIQFPELQPGDFLAILDTGAYTISMESNYNLRPSVPVYVLAEGQLNQIRKKMDISRTWENEL